MKRTRFALVLTVIALSTSLFAQSAAPVSDVDPPVLRLKAEGGAVPRLVKFAGAVRGTAGEAGAVRAVTFALYAEPSGGGALWSETQNLALDEQGRYTVMLGAASEGGIPVEMFASGAARWLEVRASGDESAAARALLVSVPYALKAEEAERLSSDGFAAYRTEIQDYVKDQVEAALARAERNKAGTNDAQGAAPRPIDVRSNVSGLGSEVGTPGVATVFSDSSTVDVVTITQAGTGKALTATSTSANAIRATSNGVGGAGAAIYGINAAASGTTVGVRGDAASTTATAVGVLGSATGATGAVIGVRGSTVSSAGFGVRGDANNTSAGTGVYGVSLATAGNSVGVLGEASGASGVAVQAKSNTSAKLFQGIKGGLPQFTVDANGNITANGSLTLGATGTVNANALNVPTAIFSSSSASQTLATTNSGTGSALLATSTGTGSALTATGATAGSTAITANSNNGAMLFKGFNGITPVFTVDNTGFVNAYAGQFQGIGGGLFGRDTSTTGITAAVQGVADSDSGAGVNGISTSLIGPNVGVRAVAAGDNAAGVFGHATSIAGLTNGVRGTSDSAGGLGGYFEATSPSGFTFGVQGRVVSSQGVAGLFNNEGGGGLLQGWQGQVGLGALVFEVDNAGKVIAQSGLFRSSDPAAVVNVTTDQPGILNASIQNLPPAALLGHATATTDEVAGVLGITDSPNGQGVIGIQTALVAATQDRGSGVGAFSVTPGGHALKAESTDPNSNTIGISARVDSPTGITLELSNSANGDLISGNVGPDQSQIQVFRVDGSGNVHANQYLDLAGNPSGGVADVIAGTGLTGGGAGPTVNIDLDTAFTDTLYAQTGASNIFTGNQTVSGNLDLVGTATVSASSISAAIDVTTDTVNANDILSNSLTTGPLSAASGSFFDSVASPGAVVGVIQSGSGYGMTIANTNVNGVGGLRVEMNDPGSFGSAIQAFAQNGSGVYAQTINGVAIQGQDQGTSGGTGIVGGSSSPGGTGVRGIDTNAGGTGLQGIGVTGVDAQSTDPFGTGVRGQALSGFGTPIGVDGMNFADTGIAVRAQSFETTGSSIGMFSEVNSPNSTAIVASAINTGASLIVGQSTVQGPGTQVFRVDANGGTKIGPSSSTITGHFSATVSSGITASDQSAFASQLCSDDGPFSIPGFTAGGGATASLGVDLSGAPNVSFTPYLNAGGVFIRKCLTGSILPAIQALTVEIDVWQH